MCKLFDWDKTSRYIEIVSPPKSLEYTNGKSIIIDYILYHNLWFIDFSLFQRTSLTDDKYKYLSDGEWIDAFGLHKAIEMSRKQGEFLFWINIWKRFRPVSDCIREKLHLMVRFQFLGIWEVWSTPFFVITSRSTLTGSSSNHLGPIYGSNRCFKIIRIRLDHVSKKVLKISYKKCK